MLLSIAWLVVFVAVSATRVSGYIGCQFDSDDEYPDRVLSRSDLFDGFPERSLYPNAVKLMRSKRVAIDGGQASMLAPPPPPSGQSVESSCRHETLRARNDVAPPPQRWYVDPILAELGLSRGSVAEEGLRIKSLAGDRPEETGGRPVVQHLLSAAAAAVDENRPADVVDANDD